MNNLFKKIENIDNFPIFLLLFWFGHIISIYLNINNLILSVISLIIFILSFRFNIFKLMIALVLGMINANIFLYPNLSENDLAYYNLNGKEITIEGVITQKKDFTYSQNLIVDVKKIYKDEFSVDISGKISLFNKSKESLDYGDKIIFRTTLYKPLKNANYGSFDQNSYLKKDGIFYNATLKKKRDLKIISKDNLTFWQKSRVGIKEIVLKRFKNRELKGFFSTILLGERTYLDRSLKDDMLSLGIMHLFAISGFHIGLLFIILYNIILFLIRQSLFVVKRINIQKFALIFSLLFIIFYLWLIEFQTSASRAVIMIFLFVMAKLLEKHFNPLNILALAAFIILIFERGVFLNVGFYLSFMAVLTFIIPIKFINDIFPYKKNYFIKYMIVNLSLFIVTTPILLFVFYKVSIGQLIFNFIYIPLFSFFIYPLAILSLILSSFIDSTILFSFNYQVFKKITEQLTGDYFIYHPINVLQLSLSMIAILSFLIFIKTKNRKFLFIIILYLSILYPITRFEGVNIFILSVGNGDAILITDNNKSLLIDAGSALKGRNGERVIAPHLDYLGIDKVDYMVLTHQDEDHYGGLSYLAKHKRVKKLYLNTVFDKPLRDINLNYELISDNVVFNFDNIKIKLFASMLLDNKNANSIITLIKYKNYSFLFTGDATKEREREFIRKYPDINNIYLLKAGHHGSKTASSLEFLKQMNPKITVFSCGLNNRFGHPNREVLDKMKMLNLKYFRTDMSGEIHLNIKNDKIKLIQFYQ